MALKNISGIAIILGFLIGSIETYARSSTPAGEVSAESSVRLEPIVFLPGIKNIVSLPFLNPRTIAPWPVGLEFAHGKLSWVPPLVDGEPKDILPIKDNKYYSFSLLTSNSLATSNTAHDYRVTDIESDSAGLIFRTKSEAPNFKLREVPAYALPAVPPETGNLLSAGFYSFVDGPLDLLVPADRAADSSQLHRIRAYSWVNKYGWSDSLGITEGIEVDGKWYLKFTLSSAQLLSVVVLTKLPE